NVAVHLLRVEARTSREVKRFVWADLDTEVLVRSMPPQATTAVPLPDEGGELGQGELIRAGIAGPEPILRRPPRGKRQARHQCAEPRPGGHHHLEGPEFDGRGPHYDAVTAGLDVSDHRVRVDLGTEPARCAGLCPDVALGVTDARAWIPHRDVVRGQVRVLRLPGHKIQMAELPYG